jgi:mannose-6-phosphate isomerase-like protein (cupin superfamily)
MTDLALTALANTAYKRVVATTAATQATVMRLTAGQAIGAEVHAGYDQLVCVVDGSGVVSVDAAETSVGPGSVVLVPGGARHDVRNTSPHTDLRLVVLYMPPKYARDANFTTAADARAAPEL